MALESPHWKIPAPLRALLWWPGVAFAVALISPDAAVGAIVVAGLVLVALGATIEAIGRRWRPVDGVAVAEPAIVELQAAQQVG